MAPTWVQGRFQGRSCEEKGPETRFGLTLGHFWPMTTENHLLPTLAPIWLFDDFGPEGPPTHYISFGRYFWTSQRCFQLTLGWNNCWEARWPQFLQEWFDLKTPHSKNASMRSRSRKVLASKSSTLQLQCRSHNHLSCISIERWSAVLAELEAQLHLTRLQQPWQFAKRC